MGKHAHEPPVFYPTMADMRGSFEAYIESIEEDLEEFGIGRIVPPAGWKPRQEGYDDIDFIVPQPITQVCLKPIRNTRAGVVDMERGLVTFFFKNAHRVDHFIFFFASDLTRLTPDSLSLVPQHATGRRGLFRTLLVEQKPLSIKHDFKPKAMAEENMPPPACLEDTSVRTSDFLVNLNSSLTRRGHSPRPRPRTLSR